MSWEFSVIVQPYDDEINKIVHYSTSAVKPFLTSVRLQHESTASSAIAGVSKKVLSPVYRAEFYFTRHENGGHKHARRA